MRDQAFAPYDAFTVGEVFNEKEEELPLFIGDGGYFSTMFDFSAEIYGHSEKGWFDAKRIDIDAYNVCRNAGLSKERQLSETASLSCRACRPQ